MGIKIKKNESRPRASTTPLVIVRFGEHAARASEHLHYAVTAIVLNLLLCLRVFQLAENIVVGLLICNRILRLPVRWAFARLILGVYNIVDLPEHGYSHHLLDGMTGRSVRNPVCPFFDWNRAARANGSSLRQLCPLFRIQELLGLGSRHQGEIQLRDCDGGSRCVKTVRGEGDCRCLSIRKLLGITTEVRSRQFERSAGTSWHYGQTGLRTTHCWTV
ncbi:hypothetical protein BDZ89DRAFT_402480, partial [Hymenopellis radicata]